MKTSIANIASLTKAFALILFTPLFTIASPVSVNPPSYIISISQNVPVKSGVEYASLDAVIINKSIIVNWVTSSEQNNGHFEVERSTDQKNFKTVGLVLDGFDGTGTGKIYKFKESATVVATGKTIYYRLKQVDNDGKTSYSAVITAGTQTRTDNPVGLLSPAQTLLSKQSIVK